NWPNDGTTRGEFQEFRIWKKARTASEIQSTMQFPIQLAPNNNDSLYYYLPLTKTNTTYPIQTINIPNNTKIPNLSTWTGRLNTAATINSQNGAGAKYYFDSSNQQLSGTYSGSLQSNEKIQYSINNGINWNNVDTALGNLWVATLPSNFRYGIIKIRGSLNDNPTNRFFNSYSVHQLYDSIFGFYNSSFQTTTAGTGGNGDYVRLPTLDMSGKYTIETWFRNTGTLGGFNRIIDFSSGTGSANGVLLGFSSSTQIGYNSNGTNKVITLPNYYITTGWNHIALTFDGTRLRLYLNGIIADSNSGGGVNAIAANTCTSNFIGRSNFSNDAATQGLFQEFRIWKTARTASEIQSTMRFPIQLVPNNNDSLYYYLPLTNSISNNPVQTVNIPNNTTLTNSSNWSGRVNSAATINSQNGSGAKYVFYDTSQKVFGTFLDTLQSNEKLQISIDAGLTWKNVDTAFNNQWIATLPTNFRTGIIQARGSINNTATSRTFSNDTFVIAPVITYQFNRIDTFLGTIGNIDSVININYRGSVSSLRYRITSGNVNGINIDSVNGNINLDGRLNVGYYPITITATNQVGSTLINIIINIQPNIDTIVGFSNSVFQTTTPGRGGSGDYITL
ncbi:MAG: LamG domain-containing protein, partial [Sediminibacterium sp.]|nr:LamG domain-containing protein [Sediminibacterium sp.]